MRLSIFIILAALIISCNNTGNEPEPEPPQFEPYQVGTWWVNSPDSATWEGSKSKGIAIAETDTTILTSSDNRLLTVKDDSLHDTRERNAFLLTFIDSTITTSSTVDISQTDFFTNFDKYVLYNPGRDISLLHDRLVMDHALEYKCGEGISAQSEIGFVLFNNDSTIFRTYLIKVSGFVDVLEDIVC